VSVGVVMHDVCMYSMASWWLSSCAYLELLLLIMLCCYSDSEKLDSD